ncbi:unnamed protein product [Angiostrongylus costaricensis]|uniref:Uncharacterized protein n=1 Tax=Angiostrongylus costaricensis TaxID=334426 RepID=A0A0R3PZJ6_ANGCS|nr:unnamed protein product [Angiostrongylus costaricensis]
MDDSNTALPEIIPQMNIPCEMNFWSSRILLMSAQHLVLEMTLTMRKKRIVSNLHTRSKKPPFRLAFSHASRRGSPSRRVASRRIASYLVALHRAPTHNSSRAAILARSCDVFAAARKHLVSGRCRADFSTSR